MTFANIALKNVRKKFSSYIVYFISTIFSVVIFNLFCCMYYNPAFSEYRFGAGKMSTLFRGSAIAVFLFSAVFVFYSGSYFIKTQKKEIAIYSLLGMRRVNISIMMFMETLFIGLLAIVCGACLGCMMSSYAMKLLMRFMAIGTNVTISIEPNAIIITVLAFLCLFAVSGIKAYQTIYRYSLLDLLSATKQTDKIPSYSIGGVLISVLLLVIGYVISLVVRVDVSGMHLFVPVLIAGVCVLFGTLLLFKNFVPAMISVLKRKKKTYYQTSNFIGISQIAFRLKTNARMLSVVALLTAITITMISASFSFYSVLAGDATKSYAPYSYLAKNITAEQDQKIRDTVKKIGDVSIINVDKMDLVHIIMYNENYAVRDQQSGEAVTGLDVNAYLISETMYERIIEETETQKGVFSETKTDFDGGLDSQSCFLIDGNAVSTFCNDLPGQEIEINYHGETIPYTVTGTSLHKYLGALDLYKVPTIVVSDENYDLYVKKASAEEIDTFYGYQFDDNMMSEKTVTAFEDFIEGRFHIGGIPGNMSYIGMYKANFALFGSYAFIGFFLGILFLLASSSVMYYKLIMEAQEEASRYVVLRKLGMKKGEIGASIAKQLGLVYGSPLVVGLIHTTLGLLFYKRALGEMGQQTPTLQNAMMIVLLFILVYGAFYVLSVKSYYEIVWKRIR